MTVSATFGFSFAFKSDINSNDQYSFVVVGKGEATIKLEASSEVASAVSQDNQKRRINMFTLWLLG